MNVLVREYEKCDAEKISNIIRRNLFEINIKDYGEKEIEILLNFRKQLI